jgi:ribosomal-protein-alanine N-acetyltransferase
MSLLLDVANMDSLRKHVIGCTERPRQDQLAAIPTTSCFSEGELILPSFTFEKLDIKTADAISEWRYSETDEGLTIQPYIDSYLVSPDNLKGPGGCDGYGVFSGGKLFGLFEYTFVDAELVIGCALEPSVKGKGYGAEFVLAGVEFGVSEYQYKGASVVLTVSPTNFAAQKVYVRAGFKVDDDDGETIRMVKHVHRVNPGSTLDDPA